MTLIFNTAPVAFGALGTPITVLAQVTDLPAVKLGAMVGRQLPFIALILPFYVMGIYGGLRSVRALWPVLAVAGGSFALAQFFSSNYLDYSLTDVLAALDLAARDLGVPAGSGRRKPMRSMRFAARRERASPALRPAANVPAWQGWIPWVIVSAVVILWTHLKIAAIAQQTIHWPGLHNAVFITLYHKAYAANWVFQPLGTGTAILVAAIITAALRRRGTRPIRRGDRRDLAAKPLGHPHGRADRRSRLSHELFRHELHAGSGRRIGRHFLSDAVRVLGLGRGVSLRQRHLGQCAVWQSAGRCGESARSESGAHRRHQFLRRRHGENDLAAKHRHRRLGHRLEGPGGSWCSRARSNTASS